MLGQQYCVVSLSRSDYPAYPEQDEVYSICFLPVTMKFDEEATRFDYELDSDQEVYDSTLPKGWSLYEVIEVPEGQDDLARDLARDLRDDFGANIVSWQSSDEEAEEEIVDLSVLSGAPLLEALLATIDRYHEERLSRIEKIEPVLTPALRNERMTSLESFEGFAIQWAKWLVQLRQEGQWELLYEDGLRTGPMDPTGLAIKFFGDATHVARLFNYDPIRPRMESELYRHFLGRFEGLYERADALWQLLDSGKTLSAAARERLARVARCYLLDLRAEAAVMCRTTLEEAYRDLTPSISSETYMFSREKELRSRGLLRARRMRFAKEVREAGNAAAHDGTEPDLLPLIAKLAEVLETLFPHEPLDDDAGPGVWPGAIRPGLCWMRPVSD